MRILQAINSYVLKDEQRNGIYYKILNLVTGRWFDVRYDKRKKHYQCLCINGSTFPDSPRCWHILGIKINCPWDE